MRKKWRERLNIMNTGLYNEICTYIESNIDLIEDNRWEEFFNFAPQGTGGILHAAGIPFLSYLKYIPPNAFAHNDDLKSIKIPNHIIDIGHNAFFGCDGIESIVIPNSVTSIGNTAFSDCSGLTSVIIPNSVTSIGSSAFWACTHLTSIEIPDSVTKIETHTFRYCVNLTRVVIPDSVTTIGACAFCTGGNNIIIEYKGNKAQWKSICHDNALMGTYYTIHCSDGDIIRKR